MSEWLSPALEFTLLGLKVAGVIGAFIGLSGESAQAGEARQRKRAWAFSFLAIAIGAELCDSLLKRKDSREQAIRFERLSHPLGTIRVTPLYAVSLAGSELKEYRARLDPAGDVLLPNRNTEPAAYALFNTLLDMYVFIYRSNKGETPDSEREPDLSFEVPFDRNRLARPLALGDLKALEMEIARERHYTYYAGEIHAQISPISNSPDDRYSNGSIISTADLFGAEIEIRFCPIVLGASGYDRAAEAAQAPRVRLETLYITFPGRQEFAISPSDKERVRTISPSGSDTCSYFYYTFPQNRDEFKKAQVP